MAIGDLCQGAVVGPRAHAYFSGVKRGGAEGSKRAECVCASGEGLVVWGVPKCREGRGQQGRGRLQVAARGFIGGSGQKAECVKVLFALIASAGSGLSKTGKARAPPWNCAL